MIKLLLQYYVLQALTDLITSGYALECIGFSEIAVQRYKDIFINHL